MKEKNHPVYSMAQTYNCISVEPSAGSYSFSTRVDDDNPQGNVRPLIGPEIGPDPRNATAMLNLSPEPSCLADHGIRYDFNHGFRIKLPPDIGPCHMRATDLETQTLLAERDVSGGNVVVGERKYFIRYRIEITDSKTGELLLSHDYDCEGKKVMIIVPDGGLGDNLAWLPYLEEFRIKHRARVTCVCGEWLIRLVQDQYPDLDFKSIANMPSSQDFYATYCCAIFPRQRKNWRPSDHQHFGMQGSVALLLGVEPVPRKVRFKLDAPRPFPDPYVCISTMATNPAKYWNYPDGWNILCRYLKSLGYRVVVLDRDKELVFNEVKYTVPEEAEDFTGARPLSERIAFLQHADFFIGLPSGLSWLAWNCNTPVVMLAGFTLDGSEFPTPYRVYNQNFCHGCWNDSECFFDMSVPVWCPKQLGTPHEIECTRMITPKMVMDAVNRIPSVRKRIYPLVTFAVPVHDPPPLLLRAMLESVIRQAEAYGNAEILLHDDGSKVPAVGMILDEYAVRYPALISCCHSEKNEGITVARKHLLDRASGKYMVLFDSDDILLPFDLCRIVKKMEADPSLLCSYGRKWFFDEHGPISESGGGAYSPFFSLFLMMQLQNGAVFRTDDLRKYKVYDDLPSGLEDNDDLVLFSRFALHGRCECEPEYRSFSYKHEHPQHSKNEDFENNVRTLVKPYQAVFDDLLRGIFPEDKAELPLAELAGAAFFLTQKDPVVSQKLIAWARTHYPKDVGLRQCAFALAAASGSVQTVQAEWTSIFSDFPGELERQFILSRGIAFAQKRHLLTSDQLQVIKNMTQNLSHTPVCIQNAWQDLKAFAPSGFFLSKNECKH